MKEGFDFVSALSFQESFRKCQPQRESPNSLKAALCIATIREMRNEKKYEDRERERKTNGKITERYTRIEEKQTSEERMKEKKKKGRKKIQTENHDEINIYEHIGNLRRSSSASDSAGCHRGFFLYLLADPFTPSVR